MDDIDAAKAELNKEKAKFQEETQEIDSQIKEIEAKVKEIEASLTDIKGQREKLVPSIDQKILKEYERILSGRDGQALVEVVNGTCGGCHMLLPPQVINEIQMKEKIIHCDSCQRMLYIRDEEIQA